MTASPLPVDTAAPERRARLAWQVWLDGVVTHPPLGLADGCIATIERASGCEVVRLDADGARVWSVKLERPLLGAPARSEGYVVVPSQGHLTVLSVGGEKLMEFDLGGDVVLPIAALGGRVWARVSRPEGPRLFVAPLDRNAPGQEHDDPLGDAGPARWRRTNQTMCVAAIRSDGQTGLWGLDEHDVSTLWTTTVAIRQGGEGDPAIANAHSASSPLPIAGAGLVDLWAAGGLLDVVGNDCVTSYEARSGTRLTTRFVRLDLSTARIAGETLLVSQPAAQGGLRINAYECAFEVLRGAISGAKRILGAGSNLLAIEPPGAPIAFFELPELQRLTLHEADALADPQTLTFARSRVWVVAHGGRSLSALDV